MIICLREIHLHIQMQWFIEVACVETLPRSWLHAQVQISAFEHSWINLRILFSLLLSTVNVLILHKVLITGNTFWWLSPRLIVSENQYLEKPVNAIIPLRHDGKAVFFLLVLCYQFAYCNSSFISVCILYPLYSVVLLCSVASHKSILFMFVLALICICKSYYHANWTGKYTPELVKLIFYLLYLLLTVTDSIFGL